MLLSFGNFILLFLLLIFYIVNYNFWIAHFQLSCKLKLLIRQE